jgi:hypothetical protein
MVTMRRITRVEAIEILDEYNEWRRFNSETEASPPMQSPKLICEAIDIAIFELLFLEVSDSQNQRFR